MDLMKRAVGQEGVHVDLQFEGDDVSPPGTDGNLRANFGEYIRYSMVVRNTGQRGGMSLKHAKLENQDLIRVTVLT